MCFYENKRRDAKYGQPTLDQTTHVIASESDLTDVQNHNFRYAM